MTTLAVPQDRHEDEIRQALLQRLADDLAVAQSIRESTTRATWLCCWLDYEHVETSGRTVGWEYNLCGYHKWLRPELRQPGDPERKPCYHWHHQAEVFLA